MNDVMLLLAEAATADPSTLTLVGALLAGNLVGGGFLWWRLRRKSQNRNQPSEPSDEEKSSMF